MALKVSITSEDLRVYPATAKSKRETRIQTGWISLKGDPHPTKFDFFLNSGVPPYKVGDYLLDAESAIVVRRGNLGVDFKLQAVNQGK